MPFRRRALQAGESKESGSARVVVFHPPEAPTVVAVAVTGPLPHRGPAIELVLGHTGTLADEALEDPATLVGMIVVELRPGSATKEA